MSIPYYRLIESDPECSHWECLSCYKQIYGFIDNWKYCPICGIQWVGRLACNEKKKSYIYKKIEGSDALPQWKVQYKNPFGETWITYRSFPARVKIRNYVTALECLRDCQTQSENTWRLILKGEKNA